MADKRFGTSRVRLRQEGCEPVGRFAPVSFCGILIPLPRHVSCFREGVTYHATFFFAVSMLTRTTAPAVHFYNYALTSARVQERILRGLRQPEKSLPSFLLYDLRGIRLFDRLCREDDQSTVVREAELLRDCGQELGRRIGRRLTLIEYGSGTARTAGALLKALQCISTYVPVDLSLASLRFGVRRLRKNIGSIHIIPVRADFTSCFAMPIVRERSACALVYLSSCALGTMNAAEAIRVLEGAGKFCGRRGGILLGVELSCAGAAEADRSEKKVDRLRRAFNLNVLTHINRRYAANFHLERFSHTVRESADRRRRELHLFSRTDQIVKIDQERVRLRSGDSILTQAKRRYSWAEIEALAGESGSEIERTWTSDGGVALCLLRPLS